MSDASIDDSRPNPDADRFERLLSEYVDRLNAGEVIDREEVLGHYPDVGADLLRELEVFQDFELPTSELTGDGAAVSGILGDFRLGRQIGRGGMGMVYEAWQASMDRPVALKILPAGVAADARTLTRFLREAKIAARLQHPNIVPVYAMGVERDTPHYAMELVEGETLAQVLARMRVSTTPGESAARTVFESEPLHLAFCAKVADAFAGVAEGLQHAHARRVIHRDLKPSNLILDREGRLRILDFGLARLEGQVSLTLSHELMGTPAYMSPEQAVSRKVPIDHRTDIYSLGATLYEMLSLEAPFHGKNHQDTLSQIITRDPPPMRRGTERIPRDLETIVLKCLRKDPSDRYGTAEALAQDLRRFARGDPIESRPQPAWEKLARRVWRRRGLVGALAAVGILLVLSSVLGIWTWRDAQARRIADYERMVLTAVHGMSLGTLLTTVESQADVRSRSHFNFITAEDYLDLMRDDARGRVMDSLEALRQAALDLPGRPEAYYHRSRGLLLLRQPAAALRELERAREADPGFAPAAVLQASVLEEQGNESGADALLETLALSAGAGWAEAWLKARRAWEEKRWQEAAAAYGRVIALEEKDREAYLGASLDARMGRGWARYFLKDFLGALEDATVAEFRWNSEPEPLLLKGATYASLGHEAEGETVFEKAYERSGRRDTVALSIVSLYIDRLRDAARGLAWCDQLRAEEPRLRLRSMCLFWLGQYQDAVDEAKRARNLYPDDPAVYRILSHALSYGLRAYNEAEEVAREAIRRFPGHVMFYVPLETALWNQRKYAEARDVLLEGLRLAPEDGFLHSKLAVKLLMLGENQEAFRMHERALGLDSHNVDVVYAMGWNLLEAGRVKEGIEVLDRCITDHPRASVPRYDRARGYERLGMVQEALEEARRAASLPPKEPWNNTYVAMLLERQGRIDEAFVVLTSGAEEYLGDPEHLRLLSLLEHREHPRGASPSRWDRLAEILQKLRPSRENDARLINALALACLHGEARKDVVQALDLARAAAEASNRREPDILATLAEAQLRTGEKAVAVVTLEEALELPDAEKCLQARLDDYRRSVLPDLPSHASLDAASIEALSATPRNETEDLRTYREARINERAGRIRDATVLLEDLSVNETARSEPVLLLADCLRKVGDPRAAADYLGAALANRFAGRRDVCELWAAISLADLELGPGDVLATLPPPVNPSDKNGFAADVRWLLEQLQDSGSVRIHCGAGGDVTAKQGEVWGYDRFFSGGRDTRSAWLWGGLDAFPGEIRGAECPIIYKTHRWFPREQALTPGYRIPLPKGTYRITLHFAELWWAGPSLRRFDVLIEDQEVLKEHDVFSEVGLATADVQSFEKQVDDGQLEIAFVPRVDNPMVSAIEITAIH